MSYEHSGVLVKFSPENLFLHRVLDVDLFREGEDRIENLVVSKMCPSSVTLLFTLRWLYTQESRYSTVQIQIQNHRTGSSGS